jgi:hypothetical protein
MKYAVEMGSVAVIYIPIFIKTGSGIQKMIGRDSQTHRGQGNLISLLSFFQNRESRIKTQRIAYYGLDRNILVTAM